MKMFFGCPLVADPDMKPGRLELRNRKGELLLAMVNLAIPKEFASPLRKGLDTLPAAPTSRGN